MAARTGRPVAELIRRAMAEYLDRERSNARSVLDLSPHDSGKLLGTWTRSELADQMRDR